MTRLLRKLSAFSRGLTLATSKFDSREQINASQREQFATLQTQILTRSPFYQPYVGNSLSKFPIMSKASHMENFDSITTTRIRKDDALEIAIDSELSRDFKPKCGGYSIGLSSGTSGSRGLFVVSDSERAEWAGFVIGKMLPRRIRRHRVALFLRANNNLYETVGGVLVKFRFFDLLQPLEKLATQLNELQPTILIAPAQVLRNLSLLDKKALSIKPLRIISVAEVLEDDDRFLIETRFDQPVHQIYQCTEGLLACTCKNGKLHLNEELMIFEKEWIDRASGRFVPIITDLRRTSQPVVRYRLDDILIQDPEGCDCGLHSTVIKKVEGRCDDALILPNKSGSTSHIYPDFVRNCLISSTSELVDYRVVQNEADEVTIQLSPNNQNIQKAIELGLEQLWQTLKVWGPKYRFTDLEDSDPMSKRRRVVRSVNV